MKFIYNIIFIVFAEKNLEHALWFKEPKTGSCHNDLLNDLLNSLLNNRQQYL